MTDPHLHSAVNVEVIATAINDILCPNTEASNYITGLTGNNSVTMTDADGNTYTVTANTKILDADKYVTSV